MPTLYALTKEWQALIDAVDTAQTQEEVDAAWTAVESCETDIAAKAEAYARIIQTKAAEAEAYKTEKARLAVKQAAAEAAIARLKANLLTTMQLVDTTEIRTTIGSWKIQRNPPSCEVTRLSDVPEEYHIPQPDTVDKAAVLRNFKVTGEIPPGCAIVQKPSLRFR